MLFCCWFLQNFSGASTGPEVQRIYSAEQIAVPPALPGILKAWTKEVIRANPQDIYSFSADWFKERLAAANRGRE